jgi:hypothetical protein
MTSPRRGLEDYSARNKFQNEEYGVEMDSSGGTFTRDSQECRDQQRKHRELPELE